MLLCIFESKFQEEFTLQCVMVHVFKPDFLGLSSGWPPTIAAVTHLCLYNNFYM